MKPKHSERSETMTTTKSSPDSNNATKALPSVAESSLHQRKLFNERLSKIRKRIVKFAYHERPGRQRIFQVQVQNTHTAEDIKLQLAKQLSEGFPFVDMSNKTIRITQGWNEVSDEFQPSAETLYTVHVLPRKETWLPLKVTLGTDQNDRNKDDPNFVIFTPQKSEMNHLREEIAKLASCPPQCLEVKLPQRKRREHQLGIENNGQCDDNVDDSGIDSDEDDKPDKVIVSDEATLSELVTVFPANSLIRARANSLLSFRVEVTTDAAREVTVLKMEAYEHDTVASVLRLVAAEMAVDSSCVRVYSLDEAVNPGRILRDYSQRNEGKFTAHVFTKAAEIRVQHYQQIFSYPLFVTDATTTSVDELERFVEKKHKFCLDSVELHNDQGRLKAESTIADLGLGRNNPVIVHTKVPEKTLEVPSKHHFPEGRIFEIDSEIPRPVPWWMTAGSDRDHVLKDEAFGRDTPEPGAEHSESKKQQVQPLKTNGEAKHGIYEEQKSAETNVGSSTSQVVGRSRRLYTGEESGAQGEDKDSDGQSPDFPPLLSSSACRPSPSPSTEAVLGGGDRRESLQEKTAPEAAWAAGQGATLWSQPEPGQRPSSAGARLAPETGLEAPRSSGFRFNKEDEQTWQTQHQKDASFSKLQDQTTDSDAFQAETPEVPRASARSTHDGKLSEDLAEKYPPDHTARTKTRQVPLDHCHTNQSDNMDDAMSSIAIVPRGNFHNHDVLPRGESTNILSLMGAKYSCFVDSENDNMMTSIESKVCLQGNRCVARRVTAVRFDPKAAEDPEVAKAISDSFPGLGQLNLLSSATPAPEPPGVISDQVLRVVAEHIGQGWMSLCLHLGVSAKDLQRIDHNYSDLWEKAFQGLLRWKGMCAGEATPAALKKGLMEKDFCMVANLIMEEKEEAAGGESVSPE